MAGRRGTVRESRTTSTSARALADVVRGQAVLAEQMKSDMGVVLEAVTGLSRKMDAMELRLQATEERHRVAVIEARLGIPSP